MEINEFVETNTGKKALKSIEFSKKELKETYGYTQEELDHIEHLMLKNTHEIYALAEQYEEEYMFQANNVYKYRKILIEIADILGAKSPVLDDSDNMIEAMFYTLPQEIKNLKDQINWYYCLNRSK